MIKPLFSTLLAASVESLERMFIELLGHLAPAINQIFIPKSSTVILEDFHQYLRLFGTPIPEVFLLRLS